MVGTPRDEQEAGAMIRGFRDHSHAVVTGIAVVDARTGRRIMFSESARVKVGSVADTEIDGYIATGGWRGKAGAYNLRERIVAGWPMSVDGDERTVMGLPMDRLLGVLRTFA